MNVPQSVADVIDKHVVFETESIDRMYLNVYQPILQTGGDVSFSFRKHRGEAFATALVMSRMTRACVAAVERYSQKHEVPIVPFEKGVRKEDVFHQHFTNGSTRKKGW